MKKKCECGNDTYTLEVMDCGDCNCNGWHDGEEYVYENVPGWGDRDQTFEEGECAMGTSFDAGCWLLTCTKCGKQIHMPLMEG